MASERRRKSKAEIGSMSIRGRFLLAPILGIILTIIYYIATSNVIYQHSEIFSKLEKKQIPEIVSFSEMVMTLTQVHNDLSSLLRNQLEAQDQETVHVLGREIVQSILGIETKINRFLAENKNNLADNKIIYKTIHDNFIKYKIAALGALELTGTNPQLAEQEVLNADVAMHNIIAASQALMQNSWHELMDQYQTITESSGDHNLISIIAIFFIALMIISALYFSKRMTQDIIKINSALVKLSHGHEDVTVPALHDPYLNELSEAVKKFQHTLFEQRSQEAQLTKINQELIEHKANLEQVIQQRTEEVRHSYERIKEAESNLVETQKLASLGALVSGISHEINTPIGISMTAASHLIEQTERIIEQGNSDQLSEKEFTYYTEDALEVSQIIVSNIKRASELIQSFKGVAVDQTSEKKREFEIRRYVGDILTSLGPQTKKTKHKINLHCPMEVLVNTIPGALSQILTNLIINSFVHGFEDIDQGTIDIVIHQSNDNIELVYRDNGCGVSEETRSKIFERFFTTKLDRGGSGLGAHIVYTLVTKALKGSITCSSTLGEGIEFKLIFPRELEAELENTNIERSES